MRTMNPLTNLPSRSATGDLDTLDVMQALISHGADPNLALKAATLRRHYNQGSDGEGTTPLLRAARVADAAAMRLLLEGGADPNRRPRNGTTALILAAGAAAREGGTRPDRVSTDTIRAVELCLAHGADVNAATTAGETALHAAAARGSDEIISLLVQRGAKLDARDKSGRTPLDVALGTPGGGGRGATAERGPIRESTAALLKRLGDSSAK
jgi:ankyrin repeat protein